MYVTDWMTNRPIYREGRYNKDPTPPLLINNIVYRIFIVVGIIYYMAHSIVTTDYYKIMLASWISIILDIIYLKHQIFFITNIWNIS